MRSAAPATDHPPAISVTSNRLTGKFTPHRRLHVELNHRWFRPSGKGQRRFQLIVDFQHSTPHAGVQSFRRPLRPAHQPTRWGLPAPSKRLRGTPSPEPGRMRSHHVILQRKQYLVRPGSPWRPQRPNNCRSTRPASWRSVANTCRPPRSATPAPRWISVPRPAMLVATVICSGLSGLRNDLGFLAVLSRIEHPMRQPGSKQQSTHAPDAATERVPIRTGRRWPCNRATD